ncbi:hypothetical protein BGZ73_000458, partial [Actinomortierella ambigua]
KPSCCVPPKHDNLARVNADLLKPPVKVSLQTPAPAPSAPGGDTVMSSGHEAGSSSGASASYNSSPEITQQIPWSNLSPQSTDPQALATADSDQQAKVDPNSPSIATPVENTVELAQRAEEWTTVSLKRDNRKRLLLHVKASDVPGNNIAAKKQWLIKILDALCVTVSPAPFVKSFQELDDSVTP